MFLTHPKWGCGNVEKFDFLTRVQLQFNIVMIVI